MNGQDRCFNIEERTSKYIITGPDGSTAIYTAERDRKCKPHIMITTVGNSTYSQPPIPPSYHYPPQFQQGNYAYHDPYGYQTQAPGPAYGFGGQSNFAPYQQQQLQPPQPQQQQLRPPSSGGNRVVGKANYHSLSSKIDVTLITPSGSATEFQMRQPAAMGSAREFESPIGRLRWKGTDPFGWSSQKLVDQDKREIARWEKKKERRSFTSLMGGGSKNWVLTIQGPQTDADAEMILVTGLVWREYRKRSDEEDKAVEEVVSGIMGG